MSSILKVDEIQDTSGNNIINENANTVTIGKAGDTVNVVGTLQNNSSALVTGKVLQVVSNTAGYTQTNNSTFTTTNYSINITPSSASNKILISAYGTLDNQGTSGNRANATIFRDSTNIGDATNGLNSVYGSNARVIAPFAMVVLDSPNTTSQITYTVRYRAVSGTVSINDQGETGQFIAMEIQAWL